MERTIVKLHLTALLGSIVVEKNGDCPHFHPISTHFHHFPDCVRAHHVQKPLRAHPE
jgi:hypothetical protein